MFGPSLSKKHFANLYFALPQLYLIILSSMVRELLVVDSERFSGILRPVYSALVRGRVALLVWLPTISPSIAPVNCAIEGRDASGV